MNDKNQIHLKYHLQNPTVTVNGGILKSTEYEDIFFSNQNGLEESRHVFCKGTNLEDLLNKEKFITIAELGFGTGLNLIAAIDLHRKLNSKCYVSYISFEINPLFIEHLKIAHQPFAEIKDLSDELIHNWPKRWPGVHKFTMRNNFFHIYLHYGDAFEQLKKLNFQANIWFLDGFCPQKNTEMWTEGMAKEIVRCSRSEAQIASFSVAAQVKKSLKIAGCIINKRPGYGKKREVLSAKAPSKPVIQVNSPPKIAIIGAGIAGASVAYALQIRGIDHVVLEQASQIAPSASGNPVGMQYAKVSSWANPITRFHTSALSYAATLAQNFNSIAKAGSITVSMNHKEVKKHKELFQKQWPNDLVSKIQKNNIQDCMGTKSENQHEWLYQEASNAIFPKKFVEGLLQKSQIISNAKVTNIKNTNNTVIISLESGETVETDLLIIAVGAQLPQFLQLLNIDSKNMEISKGQMSYANYAEKPQIAIPLHYGGYLIPSVNNQHFFGATFDKTDVFNQNVQEEAHKYNLNLMPEFLRQNLNIDKKKLQGRVSTRISSKDRLPSIGKIAHNIYGICALGAKGMTTAPILAEELLSMITPYPSILDADLKKIVNIEKIL